MRMAAISTPSRATRHSRVFALTKGEEEERGFPLLSRHRNQIAAFPFATDTPRVRSSHTYVRCSVEELLVSLANIERPLLRRVGLLASAFAFASVELPCDTSALRLVHSPSIRRLSCIMAMPT